MRKTRFAAIAVAAFAIGSTTVGFAGSAAAQSRMHRTTIATTPSAGGVVGTTLTDAGTVLGYNPTGKLRFYLFGPGNPTCTFANKGWLFASPLIPLVNGSASVANGYVTTAAGTYEWVANYSGDKYNTEARSECGKEPVTITIANPTPVVTPECIIGVDGALVGAVSETGALDGWSWIIEPGNIDVTPISADPEVYSPLDPGPYSYEFRDAAANDIAGGSFSILPCQTG
jgi:hypothetical protein